MHISRKDLSEIRLRDGFFNLNVIIFNNNLHLGNSVDEFLYNSSLERSVVGISVVSDLVEADKILKLVFRDLHDLSKLLELDRAVEAEDTGEVVELLNLLEFGRKEVSLLMKEIHGVLVESEGFEVFLVLDGDHELRRAEAENFAECVKIVFVQFLVLLREFLTKSSRNVLVDGHGVEDKAQTQEVKGLVSDFVHTVKLVGPDIIIM